MFKLLLTSFWWNS